MKKREFYKKWLSAFASDISASDIKKYVVSTGDYIWHTFSWELLDENKYLMGEEAKKAYDKEDKSDAIYIEWFENDETKDLTWELSSAKALDKLVEVYVVAKDFSWTYIKTHEGNLCGPYFMKLK